MEPYQYEEMVGGVLYKVTVTRTGDRETPFQGAVTRNGHPFSEYSFSMPKAFDEISGAASGITPDIFTFMERRIILVAVQEFMTKY